MNSIALSPWEGVDAYDEDNTFVSVPKMELFPPPHTSRKLSFLANKVLVIFPTRTKSALPRLSLSPDIIIIVIWTKRQSINQ